MLTPDGVCYDLKLSHYRCTHDNVTFVFSSQLHLDKFESRYKEHRKRVNLSLSKRFNFSVDASTLADVVLYRKIESRGFLIECKGERITCRTNLKLDGLTVTAN